MNLNFYHYVTVIAESGSLSTASERLFITQSALTQALKKMEQTFGGPLFLYQNRSMQITPSHGKSICPVSSSISRSYGSLFNHNHQQCQKAAGAEGSRTAKGRYCRMGRIVFGKAAKTSWSVFAFISGCVAAFARV